MVKGFSDVHVLTYMYVLNSAYILYMVFVLVIHVHIYQCDFKSLFESL